MISKTRLWYVTLALASTIGFYGCGAEEKPAEKIIRPVRFEQVFSSGGGRIRTFSGTARAGTESNISFKVAGTLKALYVKVGDKVQAGQSLAQIDDRDFRLQAEQARAALQSAQAQERLAKTNLETTRQLYENRSVARTDLDAARSNADAAVANVKAADRQLAMATTQLGYTRLKSPLTGAIADCPVEINENVRAGQPIVLLTSGSQLEVKVSIPEALISRIREGDESTVRFDALADQSFAARVIEVGIATVGTSPTYPVTLRLEQDIPDIRPGMAAEAEFRFESSGGSSTIVVPSIAVSEDSQERFVFVVDDIEGNVGLVKRKAVTIGEFTADGLEIVSGLSDGDYVVTAGVSRITEGMQVKLLGLKGE